MIIPITSKESVSKFIQILNVEITLWLKVSEMITSRNSLYESRNEKKCLKLSLNIWMSAFYIGSVIVKLGQFTAN